MSVKLSSLAADTAKETEGDWIEVPELPGVRLKVRSFNFPAYRVARDLLLQRMARKHGRKPAPADESEVEFGKLYSAHILLGWEGFDVEYTPAAARDALTDPAFRDLRRHVEYAASQVGASEVEFMEEAVGESKRG
jgi:hypothetical protein